MESLCWSRGVGLHPSLNHLSTRPVLLHTRQLTKIRVYRIDGGIIDWGFTPPNNSPTGQIPYGPVASLGLNQLYASTTTKSAANYEWYALVSAVIQI